MELRIAGWRSSGLRCPDVNVTLIDAIGRKGIVSVIQMPNGTGKTTTLELLRACLTGSARDWTTDKVSAYRSADGGDEGSFRLDLLVDGRPLVFEMAFDFSVHRVLYTTSSPAIGGQREGWEPPPEIRRFLYPDFVDLVVFDGEFASDILSPLKTNAERAVDAMSQLYLLDRARSLAEKERDRIVKEAGVTGNRLALEKAEEKLVAVVSQIAKVRKVRQKIGAALKSGEEEEASLKLRFDEEAKAKTGGDRQRQEVKKRIDQSKAKLEDAARNTLASIRVPALLADSFAEALRELRGGLAAVQLPSSTSRQFFFELADEEFCVCGRPLDETTRRAIVVVAERFLGQEQAGVLNAIKAQVDGALDTAETSERVSANEYVRYLTAAINDYHRAVTDLDEIEVQLAEPGGDLAELRDKLVRCGDENSKRRALLEEIDRAPDTRDTLESMCLAGLEQVRDQTERKLEALTGTVELGERTRIAVELMSRSKEVARSAVRAQLVDSGNSLLKQILRQSPIEIESMDSHIRLRAQGDASVGQKLAVGYVMLGSLLHRGAHSVPFVVDSPANPIDHTVRREVAKILPALCDQFITFVISSEKQSFTSVLADSAKAIQFITIFRNLDATSGYRARLPSRGVVTSNRFTMVEDREFFDAFDMDDE